MIGDLLRYPLGQWAFAVEFAAEPLMGTIDIELNMSHKKPGNIRVQYGLIERGNQVIPSRLAGSMI